MISSGISSDSPKPTKAPASDVVVLTRHDPTTGRSDVVRLRDGQVELGAVQPLVEGRPIHGEVVRLHPRKELPVVCDVEVEVAAAAPNKTHAGPAIVANEAYRRNWDAIWARRPSGDDLPS